jgi:hypothetical protein
MTNEETSEPDIVEDSATEPQSTEPTEETTHVRHHDPAADAAKYRHKLRDTEAQLAQAQAAQQVAEKTMYEQAVTALRSKRQALTHIDDLQRFTGKTASDYIHDGVIDLEALQTDADKLLADRPELFHTIRYTPRPDKSMGHGMGDAYGNYEMRWQDAFNTKR